MKPDIRIFGLLLLIIFSCSEKGTIEKVSIDETQIDTTETGIPEPQFITDPTEKAILSIQDTLFLGDTLKIQFKTPHTKDLAIVDPDDNFFFVVYSQNDTLMPSLADWDKFETMNEISIVTDKTKVNPWNAKFHSNQIVFTKTGKYEVLLSENLETDNGTPVEKEIVYYYHRPRTK